MKKTQKIIASTVFGLSLFSSSLAHAGANVEERQQQISILQDYRDNYYIVKDKFYLGESGLVNFVKTWSQDVTTWAENWNVIWDLVQKVQKDGDSSNLNYSLESMLAEQGYQLVALQQRYADFALRSRRVRELLVQRKMPYNKGDLYEKKIQEMVEASNALHQHITSLDKSMIERFNRLSVIANAANDRISVKLEIARVAAPESEKKVLQSLIEALEASKAVDPAKMKVQASALNVSLAIGDNRYFAAKRQLEGMKADLDRSVTEINLMTKVTEARRLAAITAMRKNYAESAKELARFRPVQIPYLVLARIKENAIPTAAYECTRPKSPVNCSLANWLSRIPEEKILKYSLVKLEALEDAWSSALNGKESDATALLSKLQGQGAAQ